MAKTIQNDTIVTLDQVLEATATANALTERHGRSIKEHKAAGNRVLRYGNEAAAARQVAIELKAAYESQSK